MASAQFGILLGEQNRHAPAPRKLGDEAEDLRDQHRRQAERRLVEHQERGSAIRPRRDREHLLLPAGEIGRRLVEPLQQDRKQLADLGEAARSAAASFSRAAAT